MGQNRTVLVEEITTAANAIGSVDPGDLQSGQIGKEVGEATLELCALCLADLASAQHAGMEEAEKIAVTLCGRNELQGMTLTELQRWCLERAALAREGLYRVRIQQALLQAGVWVGDIDQPGNLSEDQAVLAAQTGRYLLQVLQDARSAGVSDQLQVVWNATTLTLSAATQLAEYVANTASRRRQILETERCSQHI